MATQNGVYETSSGDLLRVGIGVDFLNDGSFDSTNETQRTDVPIPGKVRGDTNYSNMHRWNGSAWIEVTQALVPIVSDFISNMAIGGWNPSASLIAHWELGDITNTSAVRDSSPNKYAGVMIGGKTEDINVDSLITGGKSAHDFDGSTHAHNIDAALAGNLATATKGTICTVVEPDIVGGDSSRLVCFGQTAGPNEIALMQSASDGKLKAWCRLANVLQWAFDTTNVVISNNTKVWIILTHDGTIPHLFVGDAANGMREVPLTYSDTINKSKWFNDLPLLDNGRIGCKNANNSGNTKWFNGTQQDVRIYDINWSLNDCIGWFNNGKGTLAESGMIFWTQVESLTFLGVESGATADQTDAEIKTAYNNQVTAVSQATAEAGTSTVIRRWTAERVKQAIAALATDATAIHNNVTGEFAAITEQTDPATTDTVLTERSITDQKAHYKCNDNLPDTIIVNNGSGPNATLLGGDNTNTISQASGKIGRSLLLNGVDNGFNIDNIVNTLTGSPTGSWFIWVNPYNIAANYKRFIAVGDEDANTHMEVFQDIIDGRIGGICTLNSVTQWFFETDTTYLTNETWTAVELTHNGTEPSLYVNGTLVAITFIVDTNKTRWMTTPGFDVGRIGFLRKNGANFEYFNGEVDGIRLLDRQFTSEERSDIYNSGIGTELDILVNAKKRVQLGNISTSGTAAGDLTGTYPEPTIAANAVDNTKAADMAGHTIKVRQAGNTGDPSDVAIGTVQVVGRLSANIGGIAMGIAVNNVVQIDSISVTAGEIARFTVDGLESVTKSAAYVRNATIVEDQTLLASASATIINNNNVLAALIADLKAAGILG